MCSAYLVNFKANLKFIFANFYKEVAFHLIYNYYFYSFENRYFFKLFDFQSLKIF